MQDIVHEINIRHDRSGKYPQSAVKFPGEEFLKEMARAPLDEKYIHCVNALSPVDEPMDLS
jgi:hypothetical protein